MATATRSCSSRRSRSISLVDLVTRLREEQGPKLIACRQRLDCPPPPRYSRSRVPHPLGHRGRKDDPLYKIRTILRAGAENLTGRQLARLDTAITADDRHDEVWIAWQCAQRVRAVYHADTPAEGRELAEKILVAFPTCPIPEVARLGRTLQQCRDAFLGYFTTGGASNGGAEAVNGLIELHRRIARGFRNFDNYRLRMLLIAGGLDQAIPT